MTKEQQRADDRSDAAEKSVKSAHKDKDREEPQEATGKIAVSKKDLAVANTGQAHAVHTSASREGLIESGLEKLEQLREAARASVESSALLRPLTQLKWPQLNFRLPLESRPLRVDVVSHDDDVTVRVDVSGISRDRIDVAVSGGTLTVRGTAAAVEQQGNYHYRELPHGPLERRISLPFEVQGDKASATVKNGLLEVVLPKSERSRQQKIAIN